MNTEEKILNYMEGTLSEGESAELLHSLSVSPEKRVVLEQHIKLRELTALAQKPVSVPHALESEMAERFPAIAAYNREIAGGAMLIKESPSFISRIAASVAGFIAQYPLRTGFAVAAAAVIGYFALASSSEKKLDVASVKPSEVKTAQNIPLNENPSSSPKTESTSSKMSSASNSGMNNPYTSHKTYKSHATYSVNSSEKIAHQKQTTPPEENSSVLSISDNPMIITPGVNISQDNEHKSVHNSKIDMTDIPKKDETPKAIADNNSQTDIPPQKKADAPVDNIGNHGQNPFKNRNETASSNIPFAIRAYGALGQSLVNVHESDPTLASHTEGSGVFGIDYIANANIAIGVEAGQASYSQLSTTSSVQSDAAISRVVTANSVVTNKQWYGRAMFRYTFNPFETFRYELSGGGGMAFASQFAPVVSFSILGEYTFVSHVSFSGGFGWSGTWASVNAQNATAPPPSSAEPTGYVTVNRASQTLFTPSYSFRAGIIFRP